MSLWATSATNSRRPRLLHSSIPSDSVKASSISTPKEIIGAYADARFIDRDELAGVDTIGSSVGARLVLELARRGAGGHTVALDPGGLWQGWETAWFRSTLSASVQLVRRLRRGIPTLSQNRAARAVLLA